MYWTQWGGVDKMELLKRVKEKKIINESKFLNGIKECIQTTVGSLVF